MKAARIIALFVAAAFLLSAEVVLAADLKGTVTKIEGKTITIRDEGGKEVTLEADATGLKPGDKVEVKDGKVQKVEKKKRAIEGC